MQLAVPPPLRPKSDQYRSSMDPAVLEDTIPVHWTLNEEQTKSFLAKIFPDDKLFPPGSNIAATGTIGSIMANMRSTKQRVKTHWRYFLDVQDSAAPEERVAEFFNGVIQHVPNSHTWTRYVRVLCLFF